MAELLSIGSVWHDTIGWALRQLWAARQDPSWLTFGLAVAVGGGGLLALMLLYPMAKD